MTGAVVTFLSIATASAIGFIGYVIADIVIEKKTKPFGK
jgi:hypothetical protein